MSTQLSYSEVDIVRKGLRTLGLQAGAEPGQTIALDDNGDPEFVDPGGAGSGTVVQQDSDPGAIGAGALWIKTDLNVGQPADVLPLFVRNAADDGWLSQGLAYYVDGVLRSFVTVGDGGAVIELFNEASETLGGLAIVDGVTALRQGSIYLYLQPSSGAHGAYLHLPTGNDFWFHKETNGDTWGVSDPSGAEKFGSLTTPPDSSELDAGQRVHWFQVNDGHVSLHYMQKDSDGTVSSGVSLGIDDSYLVVRAEQLPLARYRITLQHPEVNQSQLEDEFLYDPVGFTLGQLHRRHSYPPTTVAAAGTVCLFQGLDVFDINTVHDGYDLLARVRVTNLDGTQKLWLAGSGFINNTTYRDGGTIAAPALTVESAVGDDLAFDPDTGVVSSAAGGTFFVDVSAEGEWD